MNINDSKGSLVNQSRDNNSFYTKKGFTLIEIIAIIILLSVIALITYPVINNLITDSKDDLYNKQITELERLANTWAAKNVKKLKMEEGYSYNLSFDELHEQGLIPEEQIKNPKTGEPLEGCIRLVYNLSNKNYDIFYDETCASKGEVTMPSITLKTDSGVINSYGYATGDFDVKVIGNNITSYTYCTSTSECEPSTKVNSSSGSITITQEGTTFVCVIGTDGVKSTDKLCRNYKLDKTSITPGELVIDGTLGENNWYVSDVKLSVRDVSGVTSTLNINEITNDTKGTEVVVTSTSNTTGRTITKSYNIKVDKTAPTVGTIKINGTLGLNDWYTSDVTFNVNNGSDITSGHRSTTSNITSITSDTKGTKVVVTTIDNAGNRATKEYTIKVDKTAPIPGTIKINGTLGENDWYRSDVTITVNNGSDAISGHKSTTINPNITSITSNTNGTKVVVTTIDNAGNKATREYTIKVNKDKPTGGTLVVDGTLGNNGWYVSNVKLSVIDVEGVTSTLNITEITNDTKGTEVIMTSKNNSTGAITTKTYTIKVDKTAPIVGEATFSGTKGSNDWYTTDVVIGVKDGSDALSGHEITTSNIGSIVNNTTKTSVIITTIDKAGNQTTKEYSIKVDKNTPTLTAKGSSYSIIKGVNNTVSTTYFNTPTYSVSGGSMSCNPTTTGSLAIGTYTLTCTATGGNGLKTQATTKLTVKSSTYADDSGANVPVLYNNMVPIKYENNKWIVADTSEKWYDYNAKQWANAVVLNSGVTKSVGQEVTEEEVSLWYVWIPRYKYTIFNGNNESASEQLINVTFESGTNRTGTVTCTNNDNGRETCTDSTNGSVTNNKSTYTHPAFKFGNTELTGFWFGKFSLGKNGDSVIMKPGVEMFRNMPISNYLTRIQNIKTTYGVTNADSHITKNMEWGAVAYLKQSKYGLGTVEVVTNGSSGNYTGGGSTSTAYKNCVDQTTTGNIYGVYDMASVVGEYVMGNMKSQSGEFNPGYDGGFTTLDTKYYDAYKYDSDTYTNHYRGKLGDATKETLKTYGNATSGSWYDGTSTFVYYNHPWFVRGYNNIFAFNNGDGISNQLITTRAVLTAQ